MPILALPLVRRSFPNKLREENQSITHSGRRKSAAWETKRGLARYVCPPALEGLYERWVYERSPLPA